jgi:FkbM family methyltransferase
VDAEFFELAKSVPKFNTLFVRDPPEHQWEGKYKLKRGDVFVEAGAFWGRYGLIASKRVGSQGLVMLIEPFPDNIRIIREVVETYELKNVEIIEAAVWNKNVELVFYIGGNPSSGNVTKYRVDALTKTLTVKGRTLDSLLTEYGVKVVNLLAADVENAEKELVQGANQYFIRHLIRNGAIAAYHQEENHEYIISFLQERGYKDLCYYKDLPHYGGIVYFHFFIST